MLNVDTNKCKKENGQENEKQGIPAADAAACCRTYLSQENFMGGLLNQNRCVYPKDRKHKFSSSSRVVRLVENQLKALRQREKSCGKDCGKVGNLKTDEK